MSESTDRAVDKEFAAALFRDAKPDDEGTAEPAKPGNYVALEGRLGARGSRALLAPVDPTRYEVCDCPWVPELGAHSPRTARYSVVISR